MPAKDPKGRDIAFGTPAGAVFWSRTTRIVISKLFPENAEPSAEGIAISQGGGTNVQGLRWEKWTHLGHVTTLPRLSWIWKHWMDALVFADCMRGGQVWRPVKLSCPATLVRLKVK